MTTLSDKQIQELIAGFPNLRKQIDRLTVIIEELSESLPDPDEGLELRPEVVEKLIRMENAPKSEFITMAELRSRLGR